MRYKITVHKLNVTVWSSLHKQRKKFYYVYSALDENNKLLFYTTCYHYIKKKISTKFINDIKDVLSDQFESSITVLYELTNTPAIKEYDV